MDLLKLVMNNIAILLTVIGVLAFLVSVITEVTKDVSFLRKIPTDIQVIVLSVVLCITAYLTYTSYYVIVVHWYYITACIMVAFIVSFVAMYGWDKFTTLYSRFNKQGGIQ